MNWDIERLLDDELGCWHGSKIGWRYLAIALRTMK